MIHCQAIDNFCSIKHCTLPFAISLDRNTKVLCPGKSLTISLLDQGQRPIATLNRYALGLLFKANFPQLPNSHITMDRGRPIGSPNSPNHGSSSGHHRILSSSPLAEQALVDEILACSEDNANSTGNGNFSDPGFPVHGHALCHRPSGTASGTSRPVFNQQPIYETILNPVERKLSREAEQSLLRDNHVLPPKHDGAKKSQSMAARLYQRLFSTKLPPRNIEDEPTTPGQSTERDPLLHGINSRANGADANSGFGDEFLEEQWEEAVTSGRLRTTWQREAKTIMTYSWPLITTFFLQYSITLTGIFTVGRIGKIELGAVSRE